MSLRRLALVPLLVASVACVTRSAPESPDRGPGVSGTARLTVRLLGLESDRGEVAVALYDSAQSFEDRSGAVAKGRIAPRDGSVAWTVDHLAPGAYAVAAYHDLNGNGRLDRSSLGLPSEPYGFSNDARGAFGPPKFDKAVVRIDPGDRTVEIVLR